MSSALLKNLGRREVLAALGATALPARGRAASPDATPLRRVRPGEPGWPDREAWAGLSRAVGGRLAPVTLPQPAPADAPSLFSNPFWLRDQPGLTQSSGWLDAWRSAPSAYVVRAHDAGDVSAAVRFAAAHRLRLVVKGAGHSYLGGSNAPDSLLVWTRDMEEITLHDAFTPVGSHAPPVPAVSLGAGCIWGHVYDAVTTKAGRYVQGGGCTTVGVAGLVQGGGFGSFSKRYGLAAASLLEAKVVTADGAVRTVSASREPDLFLALKGGGGGTFGVVTRLTLKTHDLPSTFGFVHWSLRATSDAAFQALLARFVDLYAERLFNPHWGEQASAKPANRFELMMLFQGLNEAEAREAWRPLTTSWRTIQPTTGRRNRCSSVSCPRGVFGTKRTYKSICRRCSKPTVAPARVRATGGGPAILGRRVPSGTATSPPGCPQGSCRPTGAVSLPRCGSTRAGTGPRRCTSTRGWPARRRRRGPRPPTRP